MTAIRPAIFRSTRVAVVVAACVLASACATFAPREPMTLEQVITASKSGTPPADIINKLQESRTVFALSGSQYAQLRADGVDDTILDYIQRTYVASVEMDTRLRYQTMYGGYGWGPPYRPYFQGTWPYWYHW
ncbi:MAG: hypothetical protein ABI794_16985 [Betaproteobacteria bacterium]